MIYPPIFHTNAIGIAILIAGVISIWFLFDRKENMKNHLALFYLIIFIPVLLSIHPNLFPFFSLILPNRSLMICALISWVLISVFIDQVFHSEKKSIRLVFKNRVKSIQNINFSKSAIVLLLVFLVFTPSLISTISFEPAQKYSWLRRHGFDIDHDALLWIHENVPFADLIMNDYSYDSRYLQGFSVKNVTSKYHLDSELELIRAVEVQDYWQNPYDILKFIGLVSKYNISYVLVTSERGYHNWLEDGRYMSKPFTSEEYRRVFDENPFLELAFEKGNASVYEVTKANTEEFQICDTDAYRWSTIGTGAGNVGRPVLIDESYEKAHSNKSLRIDIGTGTNRIVGLFMSLSTENWSQWDFITFHWYGRNSNREIDFRVWGPTTNDYYRWIFLDDWIGWRQVIIWLPFPDARYGDPSVDCVTRISFETAPETNVSWRLSEFTLVKGNPLLE
jgi:hypothetical protein